MTPPPRTWQRIIHELRSGPLPAHVALRRAGYSLNTGCGSVLATATLGCPALCEWTVGKRLWLGLLDGNGDVTGAQLELVAGVDFPAGVRYSDGTAVAANQRIAAPRVGRCPSRRFSGNATGTDSPEGLSVRSDT